MRTLLVLTTVVFAPFSIRAQNAVDMLSKAAANVGALSKSSYDFEEVQVRVFRGSISNRTEQRFRLAGSGGRYRSERLPAGPLDLFDGSYRWAYNPERNEYTKGAGVPAVAPGLTEFELAAYHLKSARVLRQESLELAAGSVVCQVVEAIADRGTDKLEYSPITYWIDPTRTLILKMDYTITFKSPASSTRVTEYFTKASIGQPVDDGLFRFTPQDGAVEVDRLIFEPKSALTGNDCPDFELKTLEGKSITRATLLGHATLLQFGLRDDDSLFQAELMYRAMRGSGLNVVYVAPMKFDAGRYTVPVAIAPASVVAEKFGLRSGAVLIDGFGKIAYAGSSQQELMRALQLAGMW